MVINHDQGRSSVKMSEPARFVRPSSAPSPTFATDEHGTIVIDASGDLVLALDHERRLETPVKFRVKTSLLRAGSPYFNILLDPSRFEEGRRVASSHDSLDGQSVERLPSTQLPLLSIEDMGQISGVKSLHLLMADFLGLLHHADLSSLPPPLTNLANLTIVADRFDALPVLGRYVQSKRLLHLIDSKSSRVKPGSKLTAVADDKLRQRCLIGLLLDHQPWFSSASQMLIQRLGPHSQQDTSAPALWKDLPMGVEDEIFCRRGYLLDTIQSLQTYFLAQYTCRKRQCRLGYDSSGACDSFQLGEMIRFFSKMGTLSLSGTLVNLDNDSGDVYHTGDLRDLIDKLRQCPEYQIDSNHRHCGLRTRLMPLLDMVDKAVEDSGLHGDLWSDSRHDYSWSEAKRPLSWRFGDSISNSTPRMNEAQERLARLALARDMCMAKSRIWERSVGGDDGVFGDGPEERKRPR